MKNIANNQSCFKLRFDLKSFLIFIFIFVVEVIIAMFVTEPITRSYVGDVLVVILMYYFVKSFVQAKSLHIIIPVLVFAYFVEIGQYFHLVNILGLQDNKVMSIIIGTSFSWLDMLSYTIGAAICFFIDKKKCKE